MEPTTSPSLQAELLKQKEELIQCLQEQLIGGRLRQAEMDSMIRDMKNQLHEHEEVTLFSVLFFVILSLNFRIIKLWILRLTFLTK